MLIASVVIVAHSCGSLLLAYGPATFAVEVFLWLSLDGVCMLVLLVIPGSVLIRIECERSIRTSESLVMAPLAREELLRVLLRECTYPIVACACLNSLALCVVVSTRWDWYCRWPSVSPFNPAPDVLQRAVAPAIISLISVAAASWLPKRHFPLPLSYVMAVGKSLILCQVVWLLYSGLNDIGRWAAIDPHVGSLAGVYGGGLVCYFANRAGFQAGIRRLDEILVDQ